MAARSNQLPVTETHSPPRGMGVNQPERTRYWTLRHWEDIVENLPVAEDRWRWTEADLPHRLLYILKECGHIKPARTVDGYWRTSRKYFEYVEATAHPEEKPVGTRVRGHSDRSSNRDAVRAATRPTEQATLFGDSTVADEDAGRHGDCAERDDAEDDDSGREVAPGQTTLIGAGEFVNAGEQGRWVVAAGSPSTRVHRAQGDEYPATPEPDRLDA